MLGRELLGVRRIQDLRVDEHIRASRSISSCIRDQILRVLSVIEDDRLRDVTRSASQAVRSGRTVRQRLGELGRRVDLSSDSASSREGYVGDKLTVHIVDDGLSRIGVRHNTGRRITIRRLCDRISD